MFNLIYRDHEDGKLFRAKRKKDVRGHMLEGGKEISHTKMYLSCEFIARVNIYGKIKKKPDNLTEYEFKMLNGETPLDDKIIKIK